MPIYEYKCEACGHTLEALQKLSDPPLALCESCGTEALRRLISAPAFRLKGSGWYETDFKSDKEKKRNLAGDGKEAAPKADGKGDAAAGKADKAGKDGAAKTAKDAPAKPAGKPSTSPEAA